MGLYQDCPGGCTGGVGGVTILFYIFEAAGSTRWLRHVLSASVESC
jgi:hypothetical protein